MNNSMTTFEERIKNTFIRYGRVPFIIILAMTLLIIVSFYAYTNIFQVKQTQSSVESSSQLVIDAINDTIDTIEENIDYNELIEDPNTYFQTLYQYYYRLNGKLDSKAQFIVFQDNHALFISQPSLLGSDYNRLINTYIRDQLSEDSLYITQFAEINAQQMSSLAIGKRLSDNLSVVFYISVDYFKEVLEQQRPNHAVISDGFDNVIATTSKDFVTSVSKFNPDHKKTIDLDHTKYTVYSKSIMDSQMKVSVLVQNQELYVLAIFISGVAGLALFFMQRINRLSAQKAGREVSGSVSILMEGVKRLEEGNLDTHVEIDTHDEFESLANAFNTMSDQLQVLMSSNERLVELRKNAEIKQLEAQFNPHFLYNSLETVRYLIEDDPKTAELLILNTSKLLRYSIAASEKEVPFNEDMEYIELFLHINKLRLGERFNYTIEIEEEVLEMNLPKLILQPLIENCLKHGYKSKDTLNVGIVGYMKDGYIYIHVIDDGDGMTPELVKSFNDIDMDTIYNKAQFGVMSVIQRIHLLYGSKGSVYVDSNSSGTHIIICIPEGGLEIV